MAIEAWQEIEELVDMYRSLVEYGYGLYHRRPIEGQKGEIDGHIPAHVIDEAKRVISSSYMHLKTL